MDRRLAQHAVDQIGGHGLFGQQEFGQLVVEHRKLIEHLAAPQLGLVVQFGGNVRLDDLARLVVVDKREHSHRNQVDQPAKGFLQMRRTGADGQVDGDRLAVEPLADFVERAEEIGPFAVHLVDQRDPGHAVLVGLMPNGFALGLDAFPGAEHHDAAVEHAQAAFDFGGEIDVAGRVDQIDLDVFPGERDRGGVDRDAAFLLLGIVVGDGRAFIDRADAVAEPAVEQHPLGDGGFARVDMGDDADVAKVVDVRHGENAGDRVQGSGTPPAIPQELGAGACRYPVAPNRSIDFLPFQHNNSRGVRQAVNRRLTATDLKLIANILGAATYRTNAIRSKTHSRNVTDRR